MNSQVLKAGDVARLFGVSMVKAHRLMRGFPHLKIGRERVTTEALLASWMAANVKNPSPVKNFDPLRRAVVEEAAWVVGELVKEGKIAVLAGQAGEHGTSNIERPTPNAQLPMSKQFQPEAA